MSLFVVCTTFATVYAISSFVFLRKPQWIHRRRQPAFIARNIAHRGGWQFINYSKFILFLLGAGEAIENSFLAFDKYEYNRKVLIFE